MLCPGFPVSPLLSDPRWVAGDGSALAPASSPRPSDRALLPETTGRPWNWRRRPGGMRRGFADREPGGCVLASCPSADRGRVRDRGGNGTRECWDLGVTCQALSSLRGWGRGTELPRPQGPSAGSSGSPRGPTSTPDVPRGGCPARAGWFSGRRAGPEGGACPHSWGPVPGWDTAWEEGTGLSEGSAAGSCGSAPGFCHEAVTATQYATSQLKRATA